MTVDLAKRSPVSADAGVGWRRCYLAGLAAVSAYSTGVAWQAQKVSYPLYRSVNAGNFAEYHLDYNHAIPLPVIVPGFAGFLAAIAFWGPGPAACRDGRPP